MDRLDDQQRLLKDMTMLIVRLARALKRKDPSSDLAPAAFAFLERKGLVGLFDILRMDDKWKDVTEVSFNRELLLETKIILALADCDDSAMHILVLLERRGLTIVEKELS